MTSRFAEANGFRPGDTLTAIADGTRLALTITGTMRTPEFIYALPPGGLMPDDAGFAVIWMPEEAASATFGMKGAFNNVGLTLRRDADPKAVIDALDTLLEPWGGVGSYERDQQLSHSFIDAEIESLRSMTVILPPVFFGIAAFLVNMVLGRIVALERSEIGLLKALGYRNSEVAAHYLVMSGLIAVVGIGIGWVAGTWLARGMAVLYAQFYDFPWLVRAGSFDTYAISGLIGLAAAALGASRSALSAARLAPAVAMAPPAPPSFRHGHFDRLVAWLGLSQPALMVLRGLLRWPVRSGSTALGLAFGVAILVSSSFFIDAMARIVDSTFYGANRQHASLYLADEAALSIALEARSLPGVLAVEPQFDLPVTLWNGPKKKQTAITARLPGGDLARVLDSNDWPVAVPKTGILLSEHLANQLALAIGDVVRVEITDDRWASFEVRVAEVTKQYIAVGAYMNLDTLAAKMREAPRVTALNLSLDAAALSEFQAALKTLPAIAASVMMTDVRDSFRDTVSQNIRINTVLFSVIAILVTVGVAYNGARIQLSERARELASLRILGFTRAEISSILLGETAVLALVAQPVGWGLGAMIATAMTAGFQSDLYRIPLVLTPATFATASLISLAATLSAALIVRRRLDRLDLVAVLKTRE